MPCSLLAISMRHRKRAKAVSDFWQLCATNSCRQRCSLDDRSAKSPVEAPREGVGRKYPNQKAIVTEPVKPLRRRVEKHCPHAFSDAGWPQIDFVKLTAIAV